MNICTIGTSWITQSFIDSCSYVDDAHIYATYSRDEQKAKEFAKKNNASKFYSSIDELLKDDNIDIVYIASPNSFHYEQSIKCLEAGKNVICEKPAVVLESQIDKIYKTAEKNNVLFLEAMKSMHSPGLKAVRDKIKSIGAIRTAHLDFSQRSSKLDAYLRGENPNIFNPKFATGGLMDLGVYNIYVACELFGEPNRIISHLDFLESGADVTGTLIFVYDDKTVTLTYSKAANGFVPSKILGDKGAITIGSLSKLTGIKFIDNNLNETELFDEKNEIKIMSCEIKDFIDYINGNNLEYYKQCTSMTRLVNKILCEIRRQNNMSF